MIHNTGRAYAHIFITRDNERKRGLSNHSFKTRLGHRFGRGTESLSRWSNHRVIS